jgi:hypothetical protein
MDCATSSVPAGLIAATATGVFPVSSVSMSLRISIASAQASFAMLRTTEPAGRGWRGHQAPATGEALNEALPLNEILLNYCEQALAHRRAKYQFAADHYVCVRTKLFILHPKNFSSSEGSPSVW